MADTEQDFKQGRPDTEFPASAFPTVFADGVSSYARGPGVVKFYLYRADANMFGRGGSVGNPFAQVVMPNSGFAHSVVFLQRCLKELLRDGQITQQELDKMAGDIEAVNVKTAQGAAS